MASLLCVVVVGLVVWGTRGRSPQYYKATVTVHSAAQVSGNLGADYAGLSVESVALDTAKVTAAGNLARLLRNLGRSVLRFGGNSADTSFTGMSASALNNLAALTKASGWSVLYTENGGHYDAARVQADAAAVSAALGTKLFAFACGNEPDVYPHNGLRPRGYSVDDYLSQSAACFRAIRAADARAPLEGPDTAGNRDWFSSYARQEENRVSWLSQHVYPLGCANSGDNAAALVGTMLSPKIGAIEAKKLSRYVTIARAAGKPLLITETNSACGGGIKGLSDTYASALWVIDYLLVGAEQGVQGMYFHTGQLDGYCAGYAVLCRTGTSTYRAQPIYYGLLFTHLLGTGKFLPISVSKTTKGGNVAAFALKSSGGGLRLMVENLSQKQLDATLRVGSYAGSASVLSLTGPSPLATSGVQIQGAPVSANGQFSPGSPSTVQCSAGSCPVTLAPYSAALVTLS